MDPTSQLESACRLKPVLNKNAANITRKLEILAFRSLQLADQVAAGQIAFLEAVDLSYDAAIRAGLPDAIDKSGLLHGTTTGDDVVQAVLAAAFANARRP